jgi:hypothetical protein
MSQTKLRRGIELMSTKVSGGKKKSQEAKQCVSYKQHNWQILIGYATFKNVHDGKDITTPFTRLLQDIQISKCNYYELRQHKPRFETANGKTFRVQEVSKNPIVTG